MFEKFYYDESNNHRKLSIVAERSAYNIDNDPTRKVPAAKNFLLGGVAHAGQESHAQVDVLLDQLRLQKSVKELKFETIASGNFNDVLKSKRLKAFLRWLLDSDLYVHYFNLNMEYWAFIDIVDDCLSWCTGAGATLTPRAFSYHRIYKDALYRVIQLDRPAFLALMASFGYPNVGDRGSELVSALRQHILLLLSDPKHTLAIEEPWTRGSIEDLLELLEVSAGIERLDLVQEQIEKLLIGGLGVFYDYRIGDFSQAAHIFDNERDVENVLSDLARTRGGRINFQFMDSQEVPLIRISDVVSGLFAKYFQYIDDRSIGDLVQAKKHLSEHQLATLDLMRQVVDKTDEKEPKMLFCLVSNAQQSKSSMFLFDQVPFANT